MFGGGGCLPALEGGHLPEGEELLGAEEGLDACAVWVFECEG